MSNSFVTLWAVACQVPLSMGLPEKNTGVGCHFPLQGILPTQGVSLSPAVADKFFTSEPPGKLLIEESVS